MGTHVRAERPESTTVAGSSLIGGVQPSNAESKTTVDTKPLAGRQQNIPIKQRSVVHQPKKLNGIANGNARGLNRRGYGNNFDQYDEMKTTGNTLNRHPATATGGKKINLQQKQKQA